MIVSTFSVPVNFSVSPTNDTYAKRKTVAEFKQEMAGKEIEKQLVLEYGAPEYVNHQEEFVTKEEYQEA